MIAFAQAVATEYKNDGDPLQRDPAERDRHARRTAPRCRTPTTRGGSSRPRSPGSSRTCSPTTPRPRAAPRFRSTAAPDRTRSRSMPAASARRRLPIGSEALMERKWWTLIVVCIATFMLLLDITIVNVALPKIASDLKANFSDIQWVIDAYALTLASTLLTAGAIADLHRPAAVFTIGLVLFAFTSLLCALSPSAMFLILARAGPGDRRRDHVRDLAGAARPGVPRARARHRARGVGSDDRRGRRRRAAARRRAHRGLRLVLDLLHQRPDRPRRGGADDAHGRPSRAIPTQSTRRLDRHRHVHRRAVPARVRGRSAATRGLGEHADRQPASPAPAVLLVAFLDLAVRAGRTRCSM